MGAQVAQISPTLFLFTYLVLASSDVATKSDESHESDEGSERCKRWKGHDSNSRVPVRCRNHRLETEGCEGSRGGHGGRSSRSIEKGWLFQDCGALNLKLKQKPATPARKGVNPFTKEPCVFKAKPASKTVRALPMKKLKELVN